MATLGDVAVFLRGDDKHLEKAFADAEGKSQSAGSKIASVFGGALKLGLAAAGSAIVGIGAASLDIATEVNQAQNDLRANFGLTEDAALKMSNVAKQVFGNNFADSFTDAANAVGLVQQQLGQLAKPEEFQAITENAFRLRDAFGVEIGEGIDAARTLMENFGVSSDRAFDLVASGFQKGLNRSGDFLDTIGEYSVQFAAGGASAEEFFGLLDSGLQGGMLGTDKAADAFKEFRVRIADGSKLTAESLKLLGLSADEVTAGLASGTLTAADAFDMVIGALQKTDDPVKRFNAGVGLIGTQFEDLGDKVATNLDLTADWAEGTEGAVGKIDAKYDNLGAAAEGFRRKFLLAIEPLGAGLLGIINEHMPAMQTTMETVVAGITTSLTSLKTGWDTDWGEIRTTSENFNTEMPKEAEAMWTEFSKIFAAGEKKTGEGWEGFLGDTVRETSSSALLLTSSFTNLFAAIGGLQTAFIGVWNNDQEKWGEGVETFWNSLADSILDIVQIVFGDDEGSMRNAIVTGLTSIGEFFTSWGAGIQEQWRQLFILPDWLGGGSLLPQAQPNLGIINPANISNNTTNTPITVNVNGGGSNGFDTGLEIGNGILQQMRQRGG